MANKIKIIFENEQWMFQNDQGRHFLVEKRSNDVLEHLRADDIAERTNDELIEINSGYWFCAEELAKKNSEDYNPVYHIGQKTWVDLKLFEEIVLKIFLELGLTPDFDVDETFRQLRVEKARALRLPPGLYSVGQICDAEEAARSGMPNAELFDALVSVAKKKFDGHLTVMQFTTNWRIAFGTPAERTCIEQMEVGATFDEAAHKALKSLKWV